MSNQRPTLLRHYEDPLASRDPRVRAVVDGLTRLDYAPAPRPQFRDELRAQLVAVAARIVEESTADAVIAARVAAARPAPAKRKRIPLARPLGVATSIVAVCGLLLGGAVWESQSALPGDALYGLKLASESVRLSLTSSDADRGHEYLQLATTRVQEAQALVGRTSAMAAGGGPVLAGGLSARTRALVVSTLRSSNSDLLAGSSLLGEQAVHSRSTALLTLVQGWARMQLGLLHTLSDSVPAGGLRTHTLTSWTLVNDARIRAHKLAPDVHCAQTARSTDRLGPLPTSTCGNRKAGTAGTGGTGAGGSAPSPRIGHRGPGHTSPKIARTPTMAPGGNHHAKASPTSSTSSAVAPHPGTSPTPVQSSPGAALPTLSVPTSVPTAPISVGSCGVAVSVGPIGVQLGSCSMHA